MVSSFTPNEIGPEVGEKIKNKKKSMEKLKRKTHRGKIKEVAQGSFSGMTMK